MSNNPTNYGDPVRELSAEQLLERIREHQKQVAQLTEELVRRCRDQVR